MTAAIIFVVTYLVIGVQRIPWLHFDRPAGALLGAIAMVVFGVIDFETALGAIDLETILFLLGMMIVLAYLELSGFFQLLERRIIGYATSARALLWIVVGSSGILSAIFMNDTICLMLTPVIVRVTRRLELPPAPYLIALATASNIGSACTIIGNPQNALIGVRSEIAFQDFTASLWLISLVGLLVDGAFLSWLYRKSVTGTRLIVPSPRAEAPLERWMLAAGMLAGAGMVIAMILGVRPAAAAMGAGAALMLAGSTRPRRALQEVDWMLLLFFSGLFVVMRGVEEAGLALPLVTGVAGPLAHGGEIVLARLGAAVTLLSQAVSNVPAVMLFVPTLDGLSSAALRAPETITRSMWLGLAAFSTLAGNLTIIGSVANVIVFETAGRNGVRVSFCEYLRVGLPLTLVTLAIAWAILSFGSGG